MTQPPTLSDTQKDAVRARADNRCQRQLAGCLHTCDVVEPAFKNPSDTSTMGRDPNSPDNWVCSCFNCSYEGGS